MGTPLARKAALGLAAARRAEPGWSSAQPASSELLRVRRDGVAHEHGDGHRADAARDPGDPARDFLHGIRIDITDDHRLAVRPGDQEGDRSARETRRDSLRSGLRVGCGQYRGRARGRRLGGAHHDHGTGRAGWERPHRGRGDVRSVPSWPQSGDPHRDVRRGVTLRDGSRPGHAAAEPANRRGQLYEVESGIIAGWVGLARKEHPLEYVPFAPDLVG